MFDIVDLSGNIVGGSGNSLTFGYKNETTTSEKRREQTICGSVGVAAGTKQEPERSQKLSREAKRCQARS